MSEPRLPLLGADDARRAAAEVGVTEVAADLNVFRVWLRHPKLASWLNGLLMGLLWQGQLDVRLRELIIMRLGWATGSDYEWTQHWRIATEWLEVDPDDLLATREWQTSDRFGAAERAVLGATDDVVANGFIGDDAWQRLRHDVSTDEQVLLEVVCVVATWRMVSTVLRSLQVPIEDDVTSWPPDGVAPA